MQHQAERVHIVAKLPRVAAGLCSADNRNGSLSIRSVYWAAAWDLPFRRHGQLPLRWCVWLPTPSSHCLWRHPGSTTGIDWSDGSIAAGGSATSGGAHCSLGLVSLQVLEQTPSAACYSTYVDRNSPLLVAAGAGIKQQQQRKVPVSNCLGSCPCMHAST